MKNSLTNMMCLDIYLSTLPEKAYKKIKKQLKTSNDKVMPLLSWDVFNQNYFQTLQNLKIESDIEIVKDFAKKAGWENEIDSIFNDQDFEALIITDAEQKILWVNDGFSQMTGYSKNFAVNKTPHFLQGSHTSKDTKQRISKGLKDLKPFTEIITNYRKDKSTYKCEVKIIPMFADNVVHFLALEKLVG